MKKSQFVTAINAGYSGFMLLECAVALVVLNIAGFVALQMQSAAAAGAAHTAWQEQQLGMMRQVMHELVLEPDASSRGLRTMEGYGVNVVADVLNIQSADRLFNVPATISIRAVLLTVEAPAHSNVPPLSCRTAYCTKGPT